MEVEGGCMIFIVDRFEGEFAVCEDEQRNIHRIKKEQLSDQIKEGDCICWKDNQYVVDVDATKKRKEKINEWMKKVFE